MIALNLPRVPLPPRIASRVDGQFPPRVQEAMAEARIASGDVRRFRSPLYREDREDALARLHAANKILAACNPGLIFTGGQR